MTTPVSPTSQPRYQRHHPGTRRAPPPPGVLTGEGSSARCRPLATAVPPTAGRPPPRRGAARPSTLLPSRSAAPPRATSRLSPERTIPTPISTMTSEDRSAHAAARTIPSPSTTHRMRARTAHPRPLRCAPRATRTRHANDPPKPPHPHARIEPRPGWDTGDLGRPPRGDRASPR